ncbi:MAG TPA: hypothetical protein VH988_22380 [Thermoanaerobaculia bacterium]|nr:hypothetical protein [Thermoanaerobaculia bacterium]
MRRKRGFIRVSRSMISGSPAGVSWICIVLVLAWVRPDRLEAFLEDPEQLSENRALFGCSKALQLREHGRRTPFHAPDELLQAGVQLLGDQQQLREVQGDVAILQPGEPHVPDANAPGKFTLRPAFGAAAFQNPDTDGASLVSGELSLWGCHSANSSGWSELSAGARNDGKDFPPIDFFDSRVIGCERRIARTGAFLPPVTLILGVTDFRV